MWIMSGVYWSGLTGLTLASKDRIMTNKNIDPQMKKLKVTSLALAQETGLSWSTIQRYKNGRSEPSKLIELYLNLKVYMKKHGIKVPEVSE